MPSVRSYYTGNLAHQSARRTMLSLRHRCGYLSALAFLSRRGFIRAETVSFEDLVACGSEKAAREKGLLRSEGKEYVVREGDVVHFRFNV